MKKYISVFIMLIALSFALCVPASASTEKVVTLSEDYKELYFLGSTYVRVDTSMLDFMDYEQYIIDSYEENVDNEEYVEESIAGVYSYTASINYDNFYTIKLTDKQHEEVKMVEVYNSNHDETLFFITIYFYDGSELNIDFIREDLVDEYNKLINGETDNYTIDFVWPDDNKISVDNEKFYIGNKTKIDAWEYDGEYYVYADSSIDSFNAEIGLIFSKDKTYYLYSFIDSDIKSTDEFWEFGDTEIEVIELTDKELIEKIKIGEEKYLEDDYGYLYNDELTEAVSKIFFVLVFALVPAVVFVASLILAIKSKKALYKKLLFATCGISVAVIVTFIYIAFTLFNT